MQASMPTANDVIAAVQSAAADQLRTALTDNPALASARDSAGVSALMHSLYRRNQAISGLLLQAQQPLDIFEATSLGSLARVQELLTLNRGLANSYSADGFTPLHFAGFFNQEAAAELLLRHGANVAAVATNPMQVTPLHSAGAGHSTGVTRLLLQNGAPPNAKQQLGWTTLHEAAQQGNKDMVELLLQHGADPNLANDSGVTAAQLAREKGHAEIATLLAA
jgi:uncharacterized protein